jgi:uncharacterized protein
MRELLLKGFVLLTATVALLSADPQSAAAWQGFAERPDQIALPRPGDREFVSDLAHLLTDADKQKIQEIGNKLLTDKATPIIVVTINSMSDYGGGGLRIETFARLLFDQWEIGQAKLQGQDWNTGILLLVSKNDRKARIELGAHWRRDQDAQAQRIMNDLMVPQFRQGNYSAGILAGVEALDKLGRGLQLPAASRGSGGPAAEPTTLHYVLLFGGLGLMIFTIVSLIRRGASGWAWIFWGLLFAGVGALLYSMMQNSGRSGGGGGFSGGSFGGGFSGGGGATGSW